MSFCCTMRHFSLPLAFKLLSILSRGRAAVHSCVLYVVETHRKGLLYRANVVIAPRGKSLRPSAHGDTGAHFVFLPQTLLRQLPSASGGIVKCAVSKTLKDGLGYPLHKVKMERSERGASATEKHPELTEHQIAQRAREVEESLM
jgi:hypothetical protein